MQENIIGSEVPVADIPHDSWLASNKSTPAKESIADIFLKYRSKFNKRGSAKEKANLMKWAIETNTTKEAVDK